MRYVVRAWGVLLFGLLAGCGGDGPTEPDEGERVAGEPSVSVTPSHDTLSAVGAERVFQVELEEADGSNAPESAAAWSSSDTRIASVDDDGRAVAQAEGTVGIVATYEGAADTARLTVDPRVDRLVVTPGVDTVDALSGETQLEADPQDANGNRVEGAVATWSTSDSTVATVDSAGRVRGQLPGEADITAEADGTGDTARITVIDPDGDQPPVARIEKPDDGAAVSPEDTISFRGSGDDLEDGELTGGDLVWNSDLDGTFGTGEQVEASDLSSGDHVVTLTATDSQGQAGADTVALRVQTKANLTVDRLRTFRRGVLASEPVEAGAVVANTGGVAVDSFRWELELDGALVADGSAGGLAAGDTLHVPRQNVGSVAEGRHIMRLTLDVDDQVDEADETDNSDRDRVVSYPAGFGIELDFLTQVDSTHRGAFENAAGRWAELITADLPDILFSSPVNFDQCADGAGDRSETIDDMLIFVRVDSIDGVGGTLGQAGPCDARWDAEMGQFLTTFVGVMTFDEADLDRMADEGTLEDVILHEMGHVIGVGSLWEIHDLRASTDTDDPIYTGAGGRLGFRDVGGDDYDGRPVPIANTGGAGTELAHWRESVFENELMTGFINAPPNPLSVVTVESLGDQYYAVDAAAADPYTLPLVAGLRARPGRRIDLGDDVLDIPLGRLHRAGRVRLLDGPSLRPAGQR